MNDINELRQAFPELPEHPTQEQITKAIIHINIRKALNESHKELYKALDEMISIQTNVVGDAVTMDESKFIEKWRDRNNGGLN